MSDISTPITDAFASRIDWETHTIEEVLGKSSKFWQYAAEIKKKASQGYEQAKILDKSMSYFKRGFKALYLLQSFPKENFSTNEREDLEKEVIRLFACCFKTTELVVTLLQDNFKYLHDLALAMYKKLPDGINSELDLDVRVCYGVLSFVFMKDQEAATSCVEIAIRKYPQEFYFYALKGDILRCFGKFEEGLDEAVKSLKIFPNNVKLLYTRATMMKKLISERIRPPPIEIVISAHHDFLKHASQDHRKRPDIFYSLAEILILTKQISPLESAESFVAKSELLRSQVCNYYQSGLKAEKYLLPCFLPYDLSDSKSDVEWYVRANAVVPRNVFIGLIDESRNVSKVVEYRQFIHDNNGNLVQGLSNLEVVSNNQEKGNEGMIKGQEEQTEDNGQARHDLSKLKVDVKDQEKENESISKGFHSKEKAKGQGSLNEELGKLEPIELWDMGRTKDRTYEGRCIKFTIVEDTMFGSLEYVQTLVEDTNGDMERCIIYGLDPRDPALQKRLAYGCRITVVNPTLHLQPDFETETCIRVDDPRNLIYHVEEKLEKRCRRCGKDGADHRCGKCRRALYCSKDCQSFDWQTMKHKLICFE